MEQNLTARRLLLETVGVAASALLILLTLAPNAPFTKELGVCESGAVRDVLAGNVILPRFIPGPIVHVPPLYWWTVAAWVRWFGWSEFAFRIASLAPAAATCAIIYVWTAWRVSREAAIWGATVLLFGQFFLDAARQPRMDAMLAMFVTATVTSLDVLRGTGRARWLMFAAAGIALGCLTKGILGIALPGAAVALFLVMRRRIAELFAPALIGAFAIGLAIGLGWYVAGYAIAGWKFLQWQIGMNLWSRFVPAEAGGANYCVHPFWYFAPQVIVGALPWSLYLIAFAALLWRSRRAMPDPIAFVLCWFAAIFALFSASRGKCQVYILPVFPPFAVLIGWTIARACDETMPLVGFRRLFTAGSLATAIGAVAIVGGAIFAMVRGLPAALLPILHPTDRRLLDIFEALSASRHYGVLSWLVLSAIGVLVILRGVWRDWPSLHVFGVLIIAVAGTRFWFGVMNPALAEHETLAPFAREVMNVVPPDKAIGHIGIEDCDLYFYAPRPITPIFHFRCGAGSASPPYLVIRKNRFDALPAEQRACLTPVLVSEVVDGNGERLLVEQSSSAP